MAVVQELVLGRLNDVVGADGDVLGRDAHERIRETIGLDCTVTVLGSGILPRFEDRAGRVVDRRRLS